MTRKILAASIAIALATGAAASQDSWQAGATHDPAYGELAAPRTDSHPIDQMVFLTRYGIEAAQETLKEWEADPSWRDRLHQRQAYRDYARERASARLEQRLAETVQRSDDASPAGEKSTTTVSSTPVVPASRNAPDRVPAMDFDAELSQLRSQVRVLTDERDDLAFRLANLEAEHAALQMAHSTLQQEHQELQLAHEALAANHTRTLAENTRLTQSYAELQRRYETLRTEHETLLATVSGWEHSAEQSAMAATPDIPEKPSTPSNEPAEAVLAREPQETQALLTAIHRQDLPSNEAIELNARGLAALDDNDPTAAVRWFLRAARAGSSNAMNNLGYLYEKGWGALPSAQEAALWYGRAAELGHIHAMRNLARFYEQGVGVLADADQAAYWRHRAQVAESRLAQTQIDEENRG